MLLDLSEKNSVFKPLVLNAGKRMSVADCFNVWHNIYIDINSAVTPPPLILFASLLLRLPLGEKMKSQMQLISRFGFVLLSLLSSIALLQIEPACASPVGNSYQIHSNITATLFWVGEDASEENAFISNSPSCWDEKWVDHYGGIDDPSQRNGHFPSAFTPKENAFYVALPYSDFNDDTRKQNAQQVIPWASQKTWGSDESMCKNQWVQITKGTKVVYAQWEDSGPYEYDDIAYVFGTAKPKNSLNQHAGIDVSPAIHDYLGLNGMDRVNWKFVPASEVPEGPWKVIITTSKINWD